MNLSEPLPIELFPADYVLACEQFSTRCQRLDQRITVREFSVPGVTPEGDPLRTQTAWVGSPQASRVLVSISGTHGVEGFAGSAIQCDLLQRLYGIKPDPDLALLFIHALTPWGYAWRRRCDESGIDLNRNFIDFSQPLPNNPGYEKLRDFLFKQDKSEREAGFGSYINQEGRTAFEMAISGGQYVDPHGPFYGGTGPSAARKIIETLMAEYDLSSRQLAVVDIHTGLGPFGYGEVICDHPLESAGLDTALRWFGDACTVPILGTSSSVPKVGLMDYAWHDIMTENSCYITLEFGTYPTQELFSLLLENHLAWQQCNRQAKATSAISMQRHFCPPDPAWRELVLFRGRQVIAQAMRGLLS